MANQPVQGHDWRGDAWQVITVLGTFTGFLVWNGIAMAMGFSVFETATQAIVAAAIATMLLQVVWSRRE